MSADPAALSLMTNASELPPAFVPWYALAVGKFVELVFPVT